MAHSTAHIVRNGGDMKAKTSVLTLALCLVAVAVCFAQDAFMGTWKLNEAKSKIAPNAPKNNTVVYEAVGDNVKITVDGIGNDGKPTHDEWTGKFDGKDYPVTRSEEHTSELQSHSDLHSFPTRRSSDLASPRTHLWALGS